MCYTKRAIACELCHSKNLKFGLREQLDDIHLTEEEAAKGIFFTCPGNFKKDFLLFPQVLSSVTSTLVWAFRLQVKMAKMASAGGTPGSLNLTA